MSKKAFLSLGSNIGDRVGHLKAAVEILEKMDGIRVSGKSSFYTTSPVGYVEQDDFINIAISVETSLSPMALLKACQSVETDLKRVRIIHWGPRSIDVDILLYEGFESNEAQLTLPHPRMEERAFVMVPIAELNPELVFKGKPVLEWCSELADQKVRKMEDESW